MPDIGGTGSVTITASPTTCVWTATSNVTWITVTSSGNGSGNGVIGYSVAENAATSSRTGTITIGGKTFTITQQGTPQYTISVVKDGTGVGTVISRDGKINCGSFCAAVYPARTSVILQPAPGAESVFTWWTGACTGTDNCTLTVSSDATASAIFDKQWLGITWPEPGTIIKGNRASVTGIVITDSGPDVGVTVNGYPATIYGDQFIVNNVPLVEGANTLKAKAIDAKGRTTSAAIGVNASTAGHYLRLYVTPEAGIAPLEVTLRLSGSFSFTQSTLSYGTNATILKNVANEYRLRLNGEGIYYFKAQVTGPDGNVYEAWAVAAALNKTQLEELLRSKWNSMKSALLAGNIDKALTYFIGTSQDRYRSRFANLTAAKINSIFSRITEIEIDSFHDNAAECGALRTETDGFYSYPLLFVRGEDGRWLIAGF
jgi:hypothetical protein